VVVLTRLDDEDVARGEPGEAFPVELEHPGALHDRENFRHVVGVVVGLRVGAVPGAVVAADPAALDRPPSGAERREGRRGVAVGQVRD
jgi:hypothetical protein